MDKVKVEYRHWGTHGLIETHPEVPENQLPPNGETVAVGDHKEEMTVRSRLWDDDNALVVILVG